MVSKQEERGAHGCPARLPPARSIGTLVPPGTCRCRSGHGVSTRPQVRAQTQRTLMSYTLRNLLIAAVLGLLGILLTTSYIRSQRQQLEHGKQDVLVIVAKKDIPAGTKAS